MELKDSSEGIAKQRRQLKFITQNLEATFGVPRNVSHEDPLDELINTILSQSTTNINSHRAFASLKQRFPDWEQARRARPASIAAAIKSGSLANVKSVVIKNVLDDIKQRRGNFDLSFLKTAPIAEARDFVMSLAERRRAKNGCLRPYCFPASGFARVIESEFSADQLS